MLQNGAGDLMLTCGFVFRRAVVREWLAIAGVWWDVVPSDPLGKGGLCRRPLADPTRSVWASRCAPTTEP